MSADITVLVMASGRQVEEVIETFVRRESGIPVRDLLSVLVP
jgi:hypothetical protein